MVINNVYQEETTKIRHIIRYQRTPPRIISRNNIKKTKNTIIITTIIIRILQS